MSHQDIVIRAARLPEDEAPLKSFIMGLQHHEFAVEPNRRLDTGVVEDQLCAVLEQIAEFDGRIFVAEKSGSVLGWLASSVREDDVYVKAEDRRFGIVDELYVAEEARRLGVGTRLIKAAEEDFRARGIGLMMIGVLPGNVEARAAYANWGFDTYYSILRKRI